MSRSNVAALQRVTGTVGDAAIYVLVLALLLAGAATSRTFLSPTEILGTAQNVALLGIVAAGVAFVTYSGHYADLSVPSIMALSGIISVATLKWGFVPSLACGIGAGMTLGAVNGWVIGYLRANPIIWTLVTAAAGDGFIRWSFNNRQAYPDLSSQAGQTFVALYDAKVFGSIPLTILVWAVLLAGGHWVLAATKYGARLKLVGSAYEVARMTGVDTRRTTLIAFLISAFTASIGGILLTSLNKTGSSTIGKGYDFMAVTAVVLGGVTLAGGRGSVWGVLGGVLAIGLMNKVMSLNGIGTFQQQTVQGCIFILVVGLSALMARRAGRDDA